MEANATESLGLDILTASKSFTVLCMDGPDKNQWIRALKPTIMVAKEAANIDPLKETWQAAPLLVQTSERNDCSTYTMSIRDGGERRHLTDPDDCVLYSSLPHGLLVLQAQAPLHEVWYHRLRQVLSQQVSPSRCQVCFISRVAWLRARS